MIRSEHEPRELNIDTVRPDAQDDTTRYDMTRYEPRAIGLQYNTYMYGKSRTVHTIRGSYCVSSGSTVRYDTIWTASDAIHTANPVQYDTIRHSTNRENADCKLRYFIYDPRDFLLRPDVFHDTIHSSYCISSGRNPIVLQMSQTDHAPIWYDLILTYGTGCTFTHWTPTRCHHLCRFLKN
jgi:hypothetical protein